MSDAERWFSRIENAGRVSPWEVVSGCSLPCPDPWHQHPNNEDFKAWEQEL